MYFGFLLGLIRLAIDTPVKLFSGVTYQNGSLLWIINNIFFQYYSLLIFLISLIIMFVVSYLTKQPDYNKISGLTFSTVTLEQKLETRNSWTKTDVIFSAIIILMILFTYIFFTG